VLTSDVKRLDPLGRLCYWISERESIRRRREVDDPPPWTDDEILRTYRFCNVRRMDDRVSKWLLENWYQPHLDHPNMLLACALARFINLPSSLVLITTDVFRDGEPAWGKIKTKLRRIRDNRSTVFNAAYMVRGNDGVDKIESVVEHNVRPLAKRPVEITRDSMRDTWERLHDRYGFGSFMAGQVVADLRWAVTGEWSDRLIWAPKGPGSVRGMNRLLGLPLTHSFSQKQFEEELRRIMNLCKSRLPYSITYRLEAMDWQNCLCELDKYERTLLDGRRPKQLYKPGRGLHHE
jgi:hypothetical protein